MNPPSPNPSPRNFLARREQVRLLALVFSLGLIIVLMSEAAKPKNWYWLWGGNPPQAAPAHNDGPAPPDENETVDTRLRPEPETFDPDHPVVEAPAATAEEDPWSAPEGVVYAENLMPGVRRADLETIRDDAAFNREENEIFYRWLVQSGRLGADRLAEKTLGPTTHLQLYKQSNVYRGRVVSLKGTIRRALRVHANENDLGVDTYYQLWLQPDDRPTLPIVVYTQHLPEGFPVGTEVSEAATLVGVPFKRWPYMARDTMRLAPLIVAPTIAWQPKAVVTQDNISLFQIALVVLVAAGLAAVVVILIVKRTNQVRSIKQSPFATGIQAAKLNAATDAKIESNVIASMQALAETEALSDPATEQD